MSDIKSIKFQVSLEGLFDGWQSDINQVDTEASALKYGRLVEEELGKAYPGAQVDFDLVDNILARRLSVTSGEKDPLAELRQEEDVEIVLQAIETRLFSDYSEKWLVEK